MTDLTKRDSIADGAAVSEPRRRLPLRVVASLIHLAISLTVASILVAIVFLVWYPSPYAAITGVVPIFAMLFGIDVTLGPFITLIIFNPKKKSLKFDLAFIAVVQLVALGYGTYSVFIARPVYVVYNVDRFDLVLANDVDPKSAAAAKDAAYRRAPLTGPLLVGANLPTDRAERNKLLMTSVAGGYDVAQMPQYYAPYAGLVAQVKEHVKPLAQLREHNQKADPRALERLKPYEAREAKIGYVPLRGKLDDLAVLIDRDSGAIVDMLELNPW